MTVKEKLLHSIINSGLTDGEIIDIMELGDSVCDLYQEEIDRCSPKEAREYIKTIKNTKKPTGADVARMIEEVYNENRVTCGNCGYPFSHKPNKEGLLKCPGCKLKMEQCDCPDLFF